MCLLRSITIEVSGGRDVAFVSDVLFELGALSVSTSELHEGMIAKDADNDGLQHDSVVSSQLNEPILWPNASITALYPSSTDTEALLMIIATEFQLSETPTFRIHSREFKDKSPSEWVMHVQAQFQPIILDRVALRFPWHRPIPNLPNIVLESGMAFGTGQHATTQLCGRWLLKKIFPGCKLLDYGTGSGVLAILAAVMEDSVIAAGVDIDQDSLHLARLNAARNGVEDRVDFFESSLEPQGELYDVVVANILAPPLKLLAEHLIAKIKRGGHIALSGLLVSQAEDMAAWYGRRGIKMTNAAIDSEWVLLVGTKI